MPQPVRKRKHSRGGLDHRGCLDDLLLCVSGYFFRSEEEKRFCDDQCERFGHGDGEPDAVDAEKFWQKKYRGDLNDERAQERNERAGCAIA